MSCEDEFDFGAFITSVLIISIFVLELLNLGAIATVQERMNASNTNNTMMIKVINKTRIINEPKHFNTTSLKNFLATDKTNEVYYDGITCRDYSDILINHLHNKGYFDECETSIILNTNMSHSLMAVNTTDGLFFVEPQTDQIFTLHIGDDYCDKVSFACARKDWFIKKISTCYLRR